MRLPKIKRETIGLEECPIFYRWTLLGEPTWPGRWPFKLMFHDFLPNADDRDVHDHPRPFWTLVLRGGYDDLVPCACQDDPEAIESQIARRGEPDWCPVCAGTTFVVGDRMRAWSLRYRPAEHRHRTRVLPAGAWTIVVMGPLQRDWGFWRRGRWVFWKDYEALHGRAMRCEEVELHTTTKEHI